MPKSKIRRRSPRKPRRIRRRNYDLLPTKFNRRTRNIIYQGLRARIPANRVAELAGINYSTYRKWKKKGENPEQYPVHACFRRKIQRIEIDHEREALDIIKRVAAGGDKITETKVVIDSEQNVETTRVVKEKAPVWQAAAWWLERRHQSEYGKDRQEDDALTVEERALQIKQAADAMFNSVPLGQ